MSSTAEVLYEYVLTDFSFIDDSKDERPGSSGENPINGLTFTVPFIGLSCFVLVDDL